MLETIAAKYECALSRSATRITKGNSMGDPLYNVNNYTFNTMTSHTPQNYSIMNKNLCYRNMVYRIRMENDVNVIYHYHSSTPFHL